MSIYIKYSNPNPNSSSYISSFDKINKINEKLDNIQFNLNAEKNLNNNQIEERLISLEQKNFDSQEELYKEFSEAKRDLSNLIRAIDEERQQYLSFYNERKKYLNNLEKRLLSKLENEQRERKDMELRLINQIDKNASVLKNELKRENKNRNESIKSFKNYLEEEVPKVIKDLKNESEERQNEDINLSKMIDEGFTKLYGIINEEKLSRENTENSLAEMVKGIINRMSAEIENEKNVRDSNEKNLISLLEQTIQKLEFS